MSDSMIEEAESGDDAAAALDRGSSVLGLRAGEKVVPTICDLLLGAGVDLASGSVVLGARPDREGAAGGDERLSVSVPIKSRLWVQRRSTWDNYSEAKFGGARSDAWLLAL